MASYKLLIENAAKAEVRALPGQVRQRIARAILTLSEEPQPHSSRPLEVHGITLEARRIRIDRWRVIYTVDPQWKEIVVYAVRKRPPYDYADLDALLKGTE